MVVYLAIVARSARYFYHVKSNSDTPAVTGKLEGTYGRQVEIEWKATGGREPAPTLTAL